MINANGEDEVQRDNGPLTFDRTDRGLNEMLNYCLRHLTTGEIFDLYCQKNQATMITKPNHFKIKPTNPEAQEMDIIDFVELLDEDDPDVNEGMQFFVQSIQTRKSDDKAIGRELYVALSDDSEEPTEIVFNMHDAADPSFEVGDKIKLVSS